MNCNKCGGDCRIITLDGVKFYKCKFCGNQFEVEPPKPVETVVISGGAVEGKLGGEAIYELNHKAVYEICAVEYGRPVASATGFFISKSGLLVTNAHAILRKPGRPFENMMISIDGFEHVAKILAYGMPCEKCTEENDVDLALLYVPSLTGISCSKITDSKNCKNGQKVYLMGNSLGEGVCITSGIISDAKRSMGNLGYPYIMTDAAANPGNSGGPLLNEEGQTIGVLVAGIEGAKGMNYAIPSNVLIDFLKEVKTKTKAPDSLFEGVFDNKLSSYAFNPSQSRITIDEKSVALIRNRFSR